MTVTAINSPLLRSALRVAILALCLAALQCLASELVPAVVPPVEATTAPGTTGGVVVDDGVSGPKADAGVGGKVQVGAGGEEDRSQEEKVEEVNQRGTGPAGPAGRDLPDDADVDAGDAGDDGDKVKAAEVKVEQVGVKEVKQSSADPPGHEEATGRGNPPTGATTGPGGVGTGSVGTGVGVNPHPVHRPATTTTTQAAVAHQNVQGQLAPQTTPTITAKNTQSVASLGGESGCPDGVRGSPKSSGVGGPAASPGLGGVGTGTGVGQRSSSNPGDGDAGVLPRSPSPSPLGGGSDKDNGKNSGLSSVGTGTAGGGTSGSVSGTGIGSTPGVNLAPPTAITGTLDGQEGTSTKDASGGTSGNKDLSPAPPMPASKDTNTQTTAPATSLQTLKTTTSTAAPTDSTPTTKTSTTQSAKGESTAPGNPFPNLSKTLQSVDQKDGSMGSSSLFAFTALLALFVMAVAPAF